MALPLAIMLGDELAIMLGEELAIMLLEADVIGAEGAVDAIAEVADEAMVVAPALPPDAAAPELLLPQAARDRPSRPLTATAESLEVRFMGIAFRWLADQGRSRGSATQATVTSSCCCPVAPSG
jgi:hypothetical protein